MNGKKSRILRKQAAIQTVGKSIVITRRLYRKLKAFYKLINR